MLPSPCPVPLTTEPPPHLAPPCATVMDPAHPSPVPRPQIAEQAHLPPVPQSQTLLLPSPNPMPQSWKPRILSPVTQIADPAPLPPALCCGHGSANLPPEPRILILGIFSQVPRSLIADTAHLSPVPRLLTTPRGQGCPTPTPCLVQGPWSP